MTKIVIGVVNQKVIGCLQIQNVSKLQKLLLVSSTKKWLVHILTLETRGFRLKYFYKKPSRGGMVSLTEPNENRMNKSFAKQTLVPRPPNIFENIL